MRIPVRFLRSISLLTICVTALITGCHKRQLAPEVEYSEAKIQQIRDEIEQMDWE